MIWQVRVTAQSEMCWIHSHLYFHTHKKPQSVKEAGLVQSTHTLAPTTNSFYFYCFKMRCLAERYLFISVALGAQEQNMKHLFRKWRGRAVILSQVTATTKATFPLLNLYDLITPDWTLKQWTTPCSFVYIVCGWQLAFPKLFIQSQMRSDPVQQNGLRRRWGGGYQVVQDWMGSAEVLREDTFCCVNWNLINARGSC